MKDIPPHDYTMTWDVDGGRPNQMWDSYQDAPHKEALVDVSSWTWRGAGPYRVRFIASDSQGHPIISRTVAVYIGAHGAAQAAASAASLSSQAVAVSSSVNAALSSAPPLLPVQNNGNPLSGMTLYVDPNSDAKRQADAWRASRPGDASALDKIAEAPSAWWFGNWNSNLTGDVRSAMNAAAGQGAIPVMVAYNIPQRDCGGYSAGGSGSPDAYRSWIASMAAAIGNRKAAVILEPDALAGMDCLSAADQQMRLSLLQNAVQTFKAQGPIAVYIDAGHPGWVATSTMAARLQNAGIGKADGFALNVSNFQTDDANRSYGSAISAQVDGKHFVVETSRNGNGPSSDNQWCNPAQRALGRKPTTDTGDSLVDAYLWIKGPGGSDGQCNGGPAAGIWWPDYALGLAQRTPW